MDQSKKAKALKQKYKEIAKRNQWFWRLTNYLRGLKCWGRQRTDKGDVMSSVIKGHPLMWGTQETDKSEIFSSVIGDHALDEFPPDLVNITCGVAIINGDENSKQLDARLRFNPLTLKDLATQVYSRGRPKRHRRRHTFFQAPYCGQTCAHHDNYFAVQTEKLRQEVQAPYYSV